MYQMVLRMLQIQIKWGEPERAPYSRALKMSVCALLKVCLFVCFWPPWYGGSFCVVERHAIIT